ncbi:LacI family DNA-binding transcriptional regulator [Aurantiacibacter flavus]|uniref:LacI family DNA-binding transcriptional regulator n=1 Tax=Aurantiacibacter flavus TaxID=3145232 RepID=A0ABV0CUQ7_9SPHN
MADVARLANVSEKSVSRVVNQESHVSAKLREKVEAAIAELGYVPDLAARSLAGSRSFTVSLLFDTRGPNYAIKLIEGAYEACKRHGYHLRIENLDSFAGEDGWLDRLGEILSHSRLDGLIVTPPFSDSAVIMDYLEDRQIRFARIAPFKERGRGSCVFMDDAAAAAQVADFLVANGHRKIGLVNGALKHGAAIARREGFLNRIAQIAPEAEISEADGDFLFESGIRAGRALLDTSNAPTAIFAANDDSAAGVMTACAQLGIRVPDDVSICGFDDSWSATAVWPYLTTIYQPISELAHEATELLIAGNGAAVMNDQVLLAHRLIERASVKNLAR